MRFLVGSFLTLCACGPLTPIRPDAGSAGGTGGGGFVLSGGFAGGVAGGSAGGVAGGVVAGGSAGGVAGGSAGGAVAGGSAGGATSGGAAGGTSGGMTGGGGGLGDFAWASVSVIPAPTASAAQTVAARPNEAYLGIGTALYRSTGGPFNEIGSFSLNTNIKDLYVSPMGKVFVIGSNAFSRICTAADCSLSANYVMQGTNQSFDYFDGLCGNGESVFAIGNGGSNQAILFEFNGTGWTKVSNDLGFMDAKRCVVAPTGEVYVLGSSFVIRYQGGSYTQENIVLPMGERPAQWNDMAFSFIGRTSMGMLVGRTESTLPQSYRYAQRNPGGGGWTVLPNPMVGSSLSSIATVGPNEFIAAGSGMPRFMSWNGTAWAPSTNQPPTSLVQVLDAASASDQEVFLVGSGTAGYVVIRGRR